MRAREFINEFANTKSIVLRSLNKLPLDSPIFGEIYKQILTEPLGNRIKNYINNRKDADAINAVTWLVKAIPTLGTADEVKTFLSKFADPNYDPINISKLVPDTGMTGPSPLSSLVSDPFAKLLFDKIFQEFSGKSDAGPGEAALAILSPSITYTSPGDILVGDKKVEVKASRGSGKAGRIWDTPINQKEMLSILSQLGMSNFNVSDGEHPFPNNELAEPFITAACMAWFGEVDSNIVAAFGKVGFKNLWQARVFDAYKAHGKWNGLLALGVQTYQYINTGEEFATNMKKVSHGGICNVKTKQARELAPQIFIK
jgi:hypothetical protein